jgi:hypothetical protein
VQRRIKAAGHTGRQSKNCEQKRLQRIASAVLLRRARIPIDDFHVIFVKGHAHVARQLYHGGDAAVVHASAPAGQVQLSNTELARIAEKSHMLDDCKTRSSSNTTTANGASLHYGKVVQGACPVIRYIHKHGGQPQQLAKRLFHRLVVRPQYGSIRVRSIVLDDFERFVAVKHFKRNLQGVTRPQQREPTTSRLRTHLQVAFAAQAPGESLASAAHLSRVNVRVLVPAHSHLM